MGTEQEMGYRGVVSTESVNVLKMKESETRIPACDVKHVPTATDLPLDLPASQSRHRALSPEVGPASGTRLL